MKDYPNNYRDMGGLPCPDNKHIRHGKLIRSASLFDLSETVIDLRCASEVADKPDYIPTGSTRVHLPVFADGPYDLVTVSGDHTKRVLALKGDGIEEMRRQKYTVYTLMPFAKKTWEYLFSCMDKGETILFHCSEGKDRTGMAAAVIEYCLGRNSEQIKEQYLLSNEYIKAHNRKTQFLLRLLGKEKRLREVIAFCETVDMHQFNAAYTAALQNYRNLDDFLLQEYCITPERKEHWRAFYLE